MRDYCEQLARVCLAPDVPAVDMDALGGDPAAWGVYRRLVRGRLGMSITAAYPRVIRRVGAAAMDAWIRGFLADAPPRTRYVRVVPTEFLAYATAHAEALGATPVDLDLAALECAIVAVTYDPDPPGPDACDPVELSMDLPVALLPAHRIVTVAWAVDLPPDAMGTYLAGPRSLCVYRAPVSHEVIALALTPVARALWDRLAAGVTVTEAFRQAAQALGVAVDPQTLGDLVGALTDLLERGLVRGARPSPQGV